MYLGWNVKGYIVRLMFKLKLYESHGDHFQQLFSAVMHYSDPGFKAVAPAGAWGDGGNDGWIENKGAYYQLYGPKASSKSNPIKELDKAITDFSKLEEKWGNIKEYYFVINDRFEGGKANLQHELYAFKQQKGLDKCEVFYSRDILDRFMSLNEGIQMEILNGIPLLGDLVIEELDYTVLSDLIKKLLPSLEENYFSFGFLHENPPDFDEKLKLNKISQGIAKRIEKNSYLTYEIDTFLERQGDNVTQCLAIEINNLYKECKVVIPDKEDDSADLRYMWMVDALVPKGLKNNRAENRCAIIAYRNTAEIILAKFFETCDVYEHPDNVVTT